MRREIDFKFVIKLIIVMFLFTPIFFGFSSEFLLPQKINVFSISIVLFGIILILILSEITVRYQITETSFENLKSHEVIESFISSDYFTLYSTFLITMIMEELIFRFYIVGLLIHFIGSFYTILVSGIIFSLFHIHIWFSHHNRDITLIFLAYSFLLGLLNAYILITLGILFSIFIHYFLALAFYYEIYKKFRQNE
jgi:membrane protease YdiL (CAAX protease family)